MAYEKQTWVNGDVITAERLNHIEDGITDACSVFVADVKAVQGNDSWTCETDTTYEDIENAYNRGKVVFIRLTVAPTGYPESYWKRATLSMTAHAGGSNFYFDGYIFDGSNTQRVSLSVDLNHTWTYADNVSN